MILSLRGWGAYKWLLCITGCMIYDGRQPGQRLHFDIIAFQGTFLLRTVRFKKRSLWCVPRVLRMVWLGSAVDLLRSWHLSRRSFGGCAPARLTILGVPTMSHTHVTSVYFHVGVLKFRWGQVQCSKFRSMFFQWSRFQVGLCNWIAWCILR